MADITRRSAGLAAIAPLALAGCATAQPQAQGGLTAAVFAGWLDRYKRAWEERDAAQAGALFTEDASYHEMPFDAPMQGRAAIEAYWARVTADQSNVRFSYEVIGAIGDQGVAHWRAVLNNGPATIELDGVFVCAFSGETVSALREWWHVKVTPPA